MLADQLRQLIVSGQIAPGEKLPSSRELQKLLCVSAITIESGLNYLVEEGFLCRRPRCGTFVTDSLPGGGVKIDPPKCIYAIFSNMSMMKSGTVKVDSVPFKTSASGAVVTAGKMRSFSTPSVSLALPENRAAAVNLLHASAWTPKAGETLGVIVAEYADGSSERVPVIARTDCGNWWNPSGGTNSIIGWTAENPEAQVGLYASSFVLKKAGPKSLKFEIAAPEAIWMIAGVTLSDRPVRFFAVTDKPVEIKANYQWKLLTYKREITKGSALDFSFLADAPAGKYGFIKPTKEGTLTFEKAPGKRIRLYGPNLCFTASYLTKEAADQLADYFVYCGYNTVRIHHHDTLLLDPKAADTVTLSAEQLDKLDYLFYKMKEKGLYITTDLFTNRVFKPGDNIPECDFYDQRQMKMLIPVSRAAMASWKEFARRWMTHKNPYTGLAWGEDPALYCLNLINEETLSNNWSRTPSSVKLYEAAFRKYCDEKKLPRSEASNGNPVFNRFLFELQDAVLAEQIRFVKDELKMKTMVTSLNYISDIPLTLMRKRFDVVDNHSYFDHPGFPVKPWSAPYSYKQASAIGRMAEVFATEKHSPPSAESEFLTATPRTPGISVCASRTPAESAVTSTSGTPQSPAMAASTPISPTATPLRVIARISGS